MSKLSRFVSGSAVAVGIAAFALAPSAAQAAPGCDQPAFALVNGSFEEPVVMANGNTYAEVVQADMPGWITEEPLGRFELWGHMNGEAPTDGLAFLEVLYVTNSLIYQDVASTPGESLTITMDHWARQLGNDHLIVSMGPVGGPYTTVLDMNDGHEPTSHSGTYVVPDGQTTTRFLIDPITSGAGESHIDNIVVTPTECLIAASAAGAGSGSGLPNTGFNGEVLLWSAVGLLAAGFILRRKRVTPATTATQREGQRTSR